MYHLTGITSEVNDMLPWFLGIELVQESYCGLHVQYICAAAFIAEKLSTDIIYCSLSSIFNLRLFKYRDTTKSCACMDCKLLAFCFSITLNNSDVLGPLNVWSGFQ